MSEIDPTRPEADALFAWQMAAIASTYFEMGKSEEETRAACFGFWEQVLRPPGMFAAAAAAVRHLPQPEVETAMETERKRHVREMLGVTSADMQLTAMMAARELLDDLAREYG